MTGFVEVRFLHELSRLCKVCSAEVRKRKQSHVFRTRPIERQSALLHLFRKSVFSSCVSSFHDGFVNLASDWPICVSMYRRDTKVTERNYGSLTLVRLTETVFYDMDGFPLCVRTLSNFNHVTLPDQSGGGLPQHEVIPVTVRFLLILK